MITTEISVDTTSGTDIVDVTRQIVDILRREKMDDGEVVLFIPGSTAALTTIEYEDGAVEDLKRAIERIAPQGMDYAHDRRWGDGNGYAHVRAALLGPSLTIPFHEGRLLLGTWQQVILLDFDNRPRKRRIIVRLRGA